MADRKTLNIKRGHVFGTLTIIKNYLVKFDDQDIESLNTRLSTALATYKSFFDIQTQIEALQDDEEDEEGKVEKFHDAYFEVVAKAKSMIKKAMPTVILPQVEHTGNHKPSDYMQLPTIKLPVFDGNYENWLAFRDTYNALVHQNESLSDIQKLHHLRSALSKDAFDLISSIQIAAANYDVAYTMLIERYENHKMIITKHVMALLNIQSLTKESPESLRDLIDTTIRHISILKQLQQPVDEWNTIVVCHITSKLDPITRREWENKHSCNTKTFPLLEELKQFIEQRCQMLDIFPQAKPKDVSKFTNCDKSSYAYRNKSSTSRMLHMQTQPDSETTASLTKSCQHCCNGNHPIYRCQQFLKLSTNDRINRVRDLNLCLNCFSPYHRHYQCTSGTCKLCKKNHNTLLHLERRDAQSFHTNTNKSKLSGNETTATCQEILPKVTINALSVNQINSSVIQEANESTSQTQVVCHQSEKGRQTTQVLLSTAVVFAFDSIGVAHRCRVLLNCGAQSNFISEHMCQLLRLKRHKNSTSVIGVNQSSSQVQHSVNVTIQSRFNNYTCNLEFLVLNHITNNLPNLQICDINAWNIPESIKLADSAFHIPGKIDMLLGSEIFFQLLGVGQIKLSNDLPTLQKTVFGWIVAGKVTKSKSATNYVTICNLAIKEDTSQLNQQIEKFWQLESVPEIKHLTVDEERCEEHFITNVKRDSNGKFIVKLPFKDNNVQLGESFNGALKRFHYTENKLERNLELKAMYHDFIKEYINLGHMVKIDSNLVKQPNYFLPHHAVLKPTSTTTKLRVVFDGSFKTSNNTSLNDHLLVGPSTQSDLFTIILRFRKYPIVMTCDIAKMYRQVQIDQEDQKFQQIIWRDSRDCPISMFKLTTVTYGTASAPYLATKCLQQLACNEAVNYPMAYTAVLNDCYVDDILTGAESLQSAIQLQSELSQMLQNGGFELHKWCTNSSQLLQQIPEESREQNTILQFDEDHTIKTLGIFWTPKHDTLSYKVAEPNNSRQVRKRTILSDIATIYDPLGLIAPVIIVAKIIMQELWQIRVEWDESLPIHLHTKWLQFRQQLIHLNTLNINRHIQSSPTTRLELHGFCDSSESAYGACIYIRSISNSEINVSLLCAKSRVAPLNKITIPRLELCAANLLAELQAKVYTAMHIKFDRQYHWSDSKIVLSWLAASPARWKNFVANRVANIQQLSNVDDWHHIGSRQNPADLLSRGVSSVDLSHSNLWWHGPNILSTHNEIISAEDYEINQEDLPETKIVTAHVSVNDTSFIDKFSSFIRLQRITAFMLRFIANAKTSKSKRLIGSLLSVTELNTAKLKLISIVQRQSFGIEINNLESGQIINKNNKIIVLNPFIDKQGILRVGGRLSNADIPFNQKHQILLPTGHLANILAQHEHRHNLHCGQKALLSILRLSYWPLRERNLVRRTVHNCIRCYKTKPKSIQQLMGNLPQQRVEPSRPFTNTGIDFCGPFSIKPSLNRGNISVKAYVATIICFATKAMHIELVGNLTTESFIGALKRFVARRGKCSRIYCDNATNFTGAKRELDNFRKFFNSHENQTSIYTTLAQESIEWHFIPPRSPHFGGLWEAGVKSAKYHLKRIMSDALLTYEEFNILLHQVESCLNSRPITAISSDPNDFNPLTPAHFLIGDCLMAIPEPDLTTYKINRLSRWQRTQQMLQHFWQRWSKDYLHQFQNRPKNNSTRIPIDVGIIVLIQDDNLPPLKWNLGKIIELHPGRDNTTRVANIKTQHGVITRVVHKLCPLPNLAE